MLIKKKLVIRSEPKKLDNLGGSLFIMAKLTNKKLKFTIKEKWDAH